MKIHITKPVVGAVTAIGATAALLTGAIVHASSPAPDDYVKKIAAQIAIATCSDLGLVPGEEHYERVKDFKTFEEFYEYFLPQINSSDSNSPGESAYSGASDSVESADSNGSYRSDGTPTSSPAPSISSPEDNTDSYEFSQEQIEHIVQVMAERAQECVLGTESAESDDEPSSEGTTTPINTPATTPVGTPSNEPNNEGSPTEDTRLEEETTTTHHETTLEEDKAILDDVTCEQFTVGWFDGTRLTSYEEVKNYWLSLFPPANSQEVERANQRAALIADKAVSCGLVPAPAPVVTFTSIMDRYSAMSCSDLSTEWKNNPASPLNNNIRTRSEMLQYLQGNKQSLGISLDDQQIKVLANLLADKGIKCQLLNADTNAGAANGGNNIGAVVGAITNPGGGNAGPGDAPAVSKRGNSGSSFFGSS